MTQVLFKDVAREWWERFMLRGSVPYAEGSWRRLEREVMPELGHKKLPQIGAPMILSILRRIESRGTLETAYKVKSHISQIMRYGIACGLIYSNPARDLTWALTPKKHKPRAAITDPRQVGMLMRDINAFPSRKRRAALMLAALTFVRPGELCRAEWVEMEMDEGVWRIPAEKMKVKRPHIVPLSRQALTELRALHALTGFGRWLFPSRWNAEKPYGQYRFEHSLAPYGVWTGGDDGSRVQGHGGDDPLRTGVGFRRDRAPARPRRPQPGAGRIPTFRAFGGAPQDDAGLGRLLRYALCRRDFG